MKKWTVSALRTGYERTVELELTWEVAGDPISDDYLPSEASANDLWRLWRRKHSADRERILWFVLNDDEGVFESAPFDPEYEDLGNFLTHFAWPVDDEGDRLRFTDLSVRDKAWREGQGDKGGFIQEFTGWKPSPLQAFMDVTRIEQAMGLR